MPTGTYTFANDYAGTTADASVWTSWLGTDGTSNVCTATVWINWTSGSPQSMTPEEVREVQARRAEDFEKRKQERVEAGRRAEALLGSFLSPEQRKTMDEIGAFLVRADDKRFRIKKTGGVVELNGEGREIASYCIQPTEEIPAADAMLAKKLMLEDDPAAFLRIAHRTALNSAVMR